MDKLTDPKSFGPGVWFSFHVRSLSARDKASKIEFAVFVKDIIAHIKCQECHDHAMAYLKAHPIEKFFDIKDEKTATEIGCFKWTWIFHNAVNKRLGKKEIDFHTALMMYAEQKKCENCTKDGHESKKESKDSKESVTETDVTIKEIINDKKKKESKNEVIVPKKMLVNYR